MKTWFDKNTNTYHQAIKRADVPGYQKDVPEWTGFRSGVVYIGDIEAIIDIPIFKTKIVVYQEIRRADLNWSRCKSVD